MSRSLLRGFIERTYSYFVPDFATNPNPSRLKPGKKLVFIQTQGQPGENMFADLFSRIEPIFKRYGFTDNYLLRGLGVRKPGEIATREEVMKKVDETAEKIMSSTRRNNGRRFDHKPRPKWPLRGSREARDGPRQAGGHHAFGVTAPTILNTPSLPSHPPADL